MAGLLPELLIQIFAHLDIHCLARAQRVCKLWNDVILQKLPRYFTEISCLPEKDQRLPNIDPTVGVLHSTLPRVLSSITKVLTLRNFKPTHLRIRSLLLLLQSKDVTLLVLRLENCKVDYEEAVFPWLWHENINELEHHDGLCCYYNLINLSLLWSSQRCRRLQIVNYKIKNVFNFEHLFGLNAYPRLASKIELPVVIHNVILECGVDRRSLFCNLMTAINAECVPVSDETRKKVATTLIDCLLDHSGTNQPMRFHARHRLLMFRVVINLFNKFSMEHSYRAKDAHLDEYEDLKVVDILGLSDATLTILSGVSDYISEVKALQAAKWAKHVAPVPW
ncbi:uncharacterized protein LOC129586506 [Paramacrobiotus metropolitanus]|uniref:uncharacterized protein LOC129586506 n=1 Tax=Paramacrobiotus metropolitanus TaxID=2943436 RepID=UPI002445BCA3|nr:uncharacterized protein LOC129586506 [Paramacrobiotus metropolitanus]